MIGETMYVVAYCNEGPDQGYVYLNRALADDEVMDERRFADEVANTLDQSIDESDGHIPNCCGDIRVEFTDHVPNVADERYQGSTCIWSGEPSRRRARCRAARIGRAPTATRAAGSRSRARSATGAASR